MAVYRKPPICPYCGEQIKAIKNYSKRDQLFGFVGDRFKGWDYDNHKCKKTDKNKWKEIKK